MSTTAEAWVRQTLGAKIQPDDSIRFDDGQGNINDLPVASFVTIFGAAIDAELARPQADQDFYVALSGSHTFTWEGEELTMTAAVMGYQPFFDLWHAEGLI